MSIFGKVNWERVADVVLVLATPLNFAFALLPPPHRGPAPLLHFSLGVIGALILGASYRTDRARREARTNDLTSPGVTGAAVTIDQATDVGTDSARK